MNTLTSIEPLIPQQPLPNKLEDNQVLPENTEPAQPTVLDEQTSRQLMETVTLAIQVLTNRLDERYPGCDQAKATTLVKLAFKQAKGRYPNLGDAVQHVAGRIDRNEFAKFLKVAR